jgi:23S rRNA (cytosine1962-C5)-methyltransferase
VIDPAGTSAYRLLHGEGDALPGIVCDVYGDTAVFQLDTPAVAQLAEAAMAAVRACRPGLRRALRKGGRRAAAEGPVALWGELPARPLVIREHGLRLEADVLHGQKTGLYLDQRENRRRVGELAEGRAVLNAFAYSGGFSVAAAMGGAARTVSVDLAGPALEAARRNFALNALAVAGHDFVQADAFEYLAAGGPDFDLVVLDPPSMASSAAAKPQALAAYRRLNELALGRLASGGLLVTASCSSHVSEDELVEAVAAAARHAGRTLRILERRGAGPDHPVHPAFPEGRYLKLLVLYVD